MSAGLPSGDLLREVARVQRDKTLQDVRDLVDRLPTHENDRSRGYGEKPRQAAPFKNELVAGLKRLREQE